MAWLAASPKHKEGSAVESRLERMERLSDDPDYGYPEVGPLGYIVDLLGEIGFHQSTGNGIIAITWQEIKAWSEITQDRLSGREYTAVKRLSNAYVNEYYRSNGKDCHGPCIDSEATTEKVERKFKSLFAMLRRPENE